MLSSVGAWAVIFPYYIIGMEFNHTVRISPTSGPPQETNAIEIYPSFAGPGKYTPTWYVDKNGNMTVASCNGCGGSSGVSGTFTCPTVTIVNGIVTAATNGSCTGGSGALLLQAGGNILLQGGGKVLLQ